MFPPGKQNIFLCCNRVLNLKNAIEMTKSFFSNCSLKLRKVSCTRNQMFECDVLKLVEMSPNCNVCVTRCRPAPIKIWLEQF